jgi:hypothetical protein
MSPAFFSSSVWVLLFALAGAALGQDTEQARKKCIAFGFKDKTASYDTCVKQVLQTVGSTKAPAKPTPTVVSPSAATQQEEKSWDTARLVDSKAGFEAYLEQYPRGRYVGLARQFILDKVLGQAKQIAEAERAADEAEKKAAAERIALEAEQRAAIKPMPTPMFTIPRRGKQSIHQIVDCLL